MARGSLVPSIGFLLAALLVGPAAAQGTLSLSPGPPTWRPDSSGSCAGPRCQYQDAAGTNSYHVEGGELSRFEAGVLVYRRKLVGVSERVSHVAASASKNLLAVTIATERMNVGFTSGISPRSVSRQYRCEVINPKSGEAVKFVDLGAFMPERLALSNRGEYIVLAGRDLQLRSDEIRIYNARSGGLEQSVKVASMDAVVVGGDGYRVAGANWQIGSVEDATGRRRFTSRDPYSIAEFEVECEGLLSSVDLRDRAIGVVGFSGATDEVAQMLADGLTLRFRSLGVGLVERQRMQAVLEELALQGSGLTEADQTVAIGELGNAHFLAFGSLRQAGTQTLLGVRLVEVSDGGVVAACQVTCRDCRPDDYLEGLGHLARAWFGDAGSN